MSKKYLFTVSCKFTEGKWVGRKLVPKNDNFIFKELDLELYKESQIKPVLSSIISKNHKIRYPYIIDVNIISKKEV